MFNKFSVAPLFNYTDSHCRYFYSLFTDYIKVYTGMVHTTSFLKNVKLNKIYSNYIQNIAVAIQFSGNNLTHLSKCVKIAEKLNFSEINFNSGCPSARAKNSNFGLYLMSKKQVIIDCLNCISDNLTNSKILISLKHRISLFKSDYSCLLDFVGDISHYTKCNYFIIHACYGTNLSRKVSFFEYKYNYVYLLKKDLPYLKVIINGGITNILQVDYHLKYVDGVMVGRGLYYRPLFLLEVDYYFKNIIKYQDVGLINNNIDKFKVAKIFTSYKKRNINLRVKYILQKMYYYIIFKIKEGVHPRVILKHILHLFRGFPHASVLRKNLINITLSNFVKFKNYFDFEDFLLN